MPQDPSLNDEQLESEIRLVGDLVLAASQSRGPLPQDEIDAVLGLEPATPPEPEAGGPALDPPDPSDTGPGERPGYPASGEGP